MATIWLGDESLPDGRIEVDLDAFEAALDTVRTYYRTNPDATELDVLITLRDAVDAVLPASLHEKPGMTTARRLQLRYWKLVAVYASGLLSSREVKYLVHAAWAIIPDNLKRKLRPVRGEDF